MVENKKLYSPGEEIFNGVTHIVGGGLGVLFLIFSLIYGPIKLDGLKTFSLCIFSISIIILYVMSTLYHMLRAEKAKKVFRIFDHCTIFLLIAGSYTPFVILGVHSDKGYIILLLVWLLAIIGITFNAINMNWKPVKILSYIFYVLMGWSIIFVSSDLFVYLNTVSFVMLLCGGIFYTGGFIFYGIGKKIKWFHSIWHLFVLLGTISHFISIIFLLV